MPDSREDTGLWDPHALPTKPQYELLLHLAQEGDPRLFVQWTKGGFIDQVSATNSAHSSYGNGGIVRCDVARFFPFSRAAWVEPDKEATATYGSRSLKVYRLSLAGREAIAQYNARKRFRVESIALAKRILAEARLATGARPK